LRHHDLAKPENRQRLIYFRGIERVRYRHPVHPGDVVEIEAVVLRLRSRMGTLKGVGTRQWRPVIDGTMTFALGPATVSERRRIAALDGCALPPHLWDSRSLVR